MNYADIEFDGIMASSLKLLVKEYPEIPAPVERVEEKEIPGRSGKLRIKSGTFEPTEIPVGFNYIGETRLWNEQWRKAKKWLAGEEKELSFMDDPNFFYKISRVELSGNERLSRKIGNFTGTFITKDGLSYMRSGKQEMDIENAKYNPGILSHPEYIITGDGVCTLTVNGKTMQINVSGDITINTDLMISYRSDKTQQNTSVKGKYEDLYLKEGKNDISITDGFTCKIKPNWRCL